MASWAARDEQQSEFWDDFGWQPEIDGWETSNRRRSLTVNTTLLDLDSWLDDDDQPPPPLMNHEPANLSLSSIFDHHFPQRPAPQTLDKPRHSRCARAPRAGDVTALHTHMGNVPSSVDDHTQAPHRAHEASRLAPTRPRGQERVTDSSRAWRDEQMSGRRRRELSSTGHDLFGGLSSDSSTSHSRPQSSISASQADDFSDNEMSFSSRPLARASEAFVDLTNDPSSPPAATTAHHTRPPKRRASSPPAGNSRTNKRSHPLLTSADQEIEEINLTNENPSAEEELLQAQQKDAIAAQSGNSDGPTTIGKQTCIICLDSFTNAATTHCGHIFCHECLTQALIAGEKASDRGVGNCPVCRKAISRKAGKTTQIVPIAFMKRSTFQKQRRRLGLLN